MLQQPDKSFQDEISQLLRRVTSAFSSTRSSCLMLDLTGESAGSLVTSYRMPTKSGLWSVVAEFDKPECVSRPFVATREIRQLHGRVTQLYSLSGARLSMHPMPWASVASRADALSFAEPTPCGA